MTTRFGFRCPSSSFFEDTGFIVASSRIVIEGPGLAESSDITSLLTFGDISSFNTTGTRQRFKVSTVVEITTLEDVP